MNLAHDAVHSLRVNIAKPINRHPDDRGTFCGVALRCPDNLEDRNLRTGIS
jgi:hypothetical protein